MGKVSALGATLDLISDKVFVGMILILMAWFHMIPMWMPVIVIFREVVISLLRIIRRHGNAPPPDVWGKTKTAISFVAILLALVQQDWKTGGMLAAPKATWLLIPMSALTPLVMLAAVLMTVLSGMHYLIAYNRAKNGKSRQERPHQPIHSGKSVPLG
jgi:CDP-diacylglycerol--glycerol-3-phosphate 3-phosphatidyltransferase